MRIFISSDLHANILATEEVIYLAKKYSCDYHINLGDAIDIGPWPQETVDLIKSEKIISLKGNHEEYLSKIGLSPILKETISEKEKNHYIWTKNMLSDENIKYLENLEYKYNIHNFNISFQHFFMENDRISEFNSYKDDLNKLDLDTLFDNHNSNIIIFGHIHFNFYKETKNKYISFGSSGCSMDGIIGKQALVIDFNKSECTIKNITLNWDQNIVRNELKNKKVPDYELISKYFMK